MKRFAEISLSEIKIVQLKILDVNAAVTTLISGYPENTNALGDNSFQLLTNS